VTQRKPPAKKKTLVWRISANAPKGEWVDPAAPPVGPSPKDLPEVSYGGWATSSFDLLSGADVSDDPDTVPNEQWDELFPPAPRNSDE
jgi:hypothetical protein